MEQRYLGTPEREKEALQSYKWNYDGIVHEFNLLHTRVGHLIIVTGIFIATYMPVFTITLANLENKSLRIFACLYLGLVALLGLATSISSISGIRQAIYAIKRYLKNQSDIEKELGKDHPFLNDVSLGRTPNSLGDYNEHEVSLRFHQVLPFIFIGIGLFQLAFTFLIHLLPIPTKP